MENHFLFCNIRCFNKRKRKSVICFINALVRLAKHFLYIPKHNKEQQEISRTDLYQSQAKRSPSAVCKKIFPRILFLYTMVHVHLCCICFTTRIKGLTPNDSTSIFFKFLSVKVNSWSRV